MDPTQANPNVQRMVNALKGLPQAPQARPYTPNYQAPVPMLNPNAPHTAATYPQQVIASRLAAAHQAAAQVPGQRY